MRPTKLCLALVALLLPSASAVTSHSSTEGSAPSSTSPTTPTKGSVTEELEDTLVSGLMGGSEEDSLPTLLPTGLMPPRKAVQESETTWGPPAKPAVTNVGSGFLIIRIIETIRPQEPPSTLPLTLKDVTTKDVTLKDVTTKAADEDSSGSEDKDEGGETNVRSLKDEEGQDEKDDLTGANFIHPAFLYSPYAFGRGYSPYYYGRPYGGYRPYYRYW